MARMAVVLPIIGIGIYLVYEIISQALIRVEKKRAHYRSAAVREEHRKQQQAIEEAYVFLQKAQISLHLLLVLIVLLSVLATVLTL